MIRNKGNKLFLVKWGISTDLFIKVEYSAINYKDALAATGKAKITKKTKAIMAVSLFGLPLDIDPIMKLAKKHNLIVIDDSAETLCGKYKAKFAGSHADIGVYSFENKKHMCIEKTDLKHIETMLYSKNTKYGSRPEMSKLACKWITWLNGIRTVSYTHLTLPTKA